MNIEMACKGLGLRLHRDVTVSNPWDGMAVRVVPFVVEGLFQLSNDWDMKSCESEIQVSWVLKAELYRRQLTRFEKWERVGQYLDMKLEDFMPRNQQHVFNGGA